MVQRQRFSPGAYVANPPPVGTKCLFYAMCKNQMLIVEVIQKIMVPIFSNIKKYFLTNIKKWSILTKNVIFLCFVD